MNDALKNIRITHREAEVSIRGDLSLSPSERERFYLQLRDFLGIKEAIVLSTCNRTEVFYVHARDLNRKIAGLLCAFKGKKTDAYLPYFEMLTDHSQSLERLYRVAIGLDSQVLGDQQIFGQVKEAYQESTDLGFAKTLLHRVMHSVFYAHKLVCQNTRFKEGASSVSYNAVKLLDGQDLDTRVLVIGAGKMGSDVCKNLVLNGFKNVTITNRTKTKATKLAEQLGILTLPYAQLSNKVSSYQVIISAASGDTPILAQPKTKSFKTTLIDLCTPRSISQKFIECHASSYHNIDDIGNLTLQTLEIRSTEIPQVEQIITECIGELKDWMEEYGQTAHLQKFKQTLEALRQESLSMYLQKMDDSQQQMLEDLSKTLIQRIIKLPALQLKQNCQREQADQLGKTLNELFNIENRTINKQ